MGKCGGRDCNAHTRKMNITQQEIEEDARAKQDILSGILSQFHEEMNTIELEQKKVLDELNDKKYE